MTLLTSAMYINGKILSVTASVAQMKDTFGDEPRDVSDGKSRYEWFVELESGKKFFLYDWCEDWTDDRMSEDSVIDWHIGFEIGKGSISDKYELQEMIDDKIQERNEERQERWDERLSR